MVFGKEKSIKSVICNYLSSKLGIEPPKGFKKISRLLMKIDLFKKLSKKMSYFILFNSDANFGYENKDFLFSRISPGYITCQKWVTFYRRKYPDYLIFVETGTYLGYMLLSQIDHFDKLYSIEIEKFLYDNAIQKFKEFEKVEILKGDSSKVLPKILNKIDKKAIFWLDAVCFGTDIYFSISGLTATGKGKENKPIYKELDLILNQGLKHIIIINAIGLPENENSVSIYPSIEGIKKYVLGKKPNVTIEMQDRIMAVIL